MSTPIKIHSTEPEMERGDLNLIINEFYKMELKFYTELCSKALGHEFKQERDGHRFMRAFDENDLQGKEYFCFDDVCIGTVVKHYMRNTPTIEFIPKT